MPLLLVTGGPASGKTTIVARIVDFFKSKGFNDIDVVNDGVSAFTKDKYNDAKMVAFLAVPSNRASLPRKKCTGMPCGRPCKDFLLRTGWLSVIPLTT